MGLQGQAAGQRPTAVIGNVTPLVAGYPLPDAADELRTVLASIESITIDDDLGPELPKLRRAVK